MLPLTLLVGGLALELIKSSQKKIENPRKTNENVNKVQIRFSKLKKKKKESAVKEMIFY